MSLLVIGRTGQLARSLQIAARRTSMPLIAIGRPEIDVRRTATVGQALDQHGPSIVVNAAAYTAVDKAERAPEEAKQLNADGAGDLARACWQRRIPLIHISTDYVFDGLKEAPYSEDDRCNPINVYGQTKLEGERQVAEHHPQHVILRTSWVHSPFGGNFVGAILKASKNGLPLRVIDDQVGSPTYALDLAETILNLALHVGQGDRRTFPWGVYHVCNAGETSWYGLARAIIDKAIPEEDRPWIEPISTAAYGAAAARPANSRLNCGKLSSSFGLALRDWRLGLEDCVGRIAGSPVEPGLR